MEITRKTKTVKFEDIVLDDDDDDLSEEVSKNKQNSPKSIKEKDLDDKVKSTFLWSLGR